jgi:hypothetical protein
MRAVLDAAPGRKLYAMNWLHEQFIDSEVVIQIPPDWNSAENITSVDEINGDGTFESFGHFNANNLARIKLPWSQPEVRAIFVQVLTEYNAAMEKYTKGTGGGSGTRALFAVWDEAQTEQHKKWKERPVGWIAQYAGQMVMLYLGVVLMWDAKYGYIFTSRKEPMPDDCMIDDNFFAEGGTGEDGEGFGGAIDNNNNINAFRTPRVTLGSRKGTKSSSSSKSDVGSMLSELKEGRASCKATQDEMLQLVKDNMTVAAAPAMTTSQPSTKDDAALVNDISNTMKVIAGCTKRLRELKKKRINLATKNNNSAGAKKMMKRLLKQIKRKQKLINTLEDTLNSQEEQLSAVNKLKLKGQLKDDEDEHGSDDDDDDDDDDKDGDDSDGDDSDGNDSDGDDSE